MSDSKNIITTVIILAALFVVGAWMFLVPKHAANPSTGGSNAEIVYENASTDLIRVTTPTPGAVTGKQFKVMGEARGNWFFEASFPITVLDKDGAALTTVVAQAGSEWMTTEFVPFTADVSIPESYIGSATIILNKDNPSGLPEHDASISFPITIEY